MILRFYSCSRTKAFIASNGTLVRPSHEFCPLWSFAAKSQVCLGLRTRDLSVPDVKSVLGLLLLIERGTGSTASTNRS